MSARASNSSSDFERAAPLGLLGAKLAMIGFYDSTLRPIRNVPKDLSIRASVSVIKMKRC